MEPLLKSNNIVNINILFLMNVIEIMEIFNLGLIGKVVFISYIIYIRAETPCSSGFWGVNDVLVGVNEAIRAEKVYFCRVVK